MHRAFFICEYINNETIVLALDLAENILAVGQLRALLEILLLLVRQLRFKGQFIVAVLAVTVVVDRDV